MKFIAAVTVVTSIAATIQGAAFQMRERPEVTACMDRNADSTIFGAQAIASRIYDRIGIPIHWSRRTPECTAAWNSILSTSSMDAPGLVRARSSGSTKFLYRAGEMGMRIGLLFLYLSSTLGERYAVAQDLTGHPVLGAACTDFNQTAMNYLAIGRLKDAESTLSAVLADPTSGSEQRCGWLTLHNMAIVMTLSGRLGEAEVLEKRSINILEKGYSPDDPVLLLPLLSLAQIQYEQRQIAKARETFQKLQSIPTERPADRAAVHGLAAALLYIEGRYHEAEPEYLKALGAWEESGGGETTDVASVLDGLAAVYVVDGRYREAGRTLDRAIAILTSAKGAVATDWIKLFSSRAELHIRQGEWREAEADLAVAISAADRDTRLDPALLKSLLADYAHVLRKNHRGREARSIEARAAALHTGKLTNGVVDISELLAKPRTDKK